MTTTATATAHRTNLRFLDSIAPETIRTTQPGPGVTATDSGPGAQSGGPSPPSQDVRFGARTRNLSDENRARTWLMRGSSADAAASPASAAVDGLNIPIPGFLSGLLDRAKDEIVKRGADALFELLEKLPGDIDDGELRKIMDLGRVKAPERELSSDEKAEIKKVFGDSVDVDKVRVREGDIGLFNRDDRPLVLGNTILVPSGRLENGHIPKEDLIHEATHVWQFQHGGIDYIKDSIKNQLTEGEGAYEFEDEVLANVPWEKLGAEEQGALIEKAFEDGYFNGTNQKFMVRGEDRTEYLNNAIAQLRSGSGAP